MSCKNICVEFKAAKTKRSSPYLYGGKWCGVCSIFIKWTGTQCPCCNRILRTSPRSKRDWSHMPSTVYHNLINGKATTGQGYAKPVRRQSGMPHQRQAVEASHKR